MFRSQNYPILNQSKVFQQYCHQFEFCCKSATIMGKKKNDRHKSCPSLSQRQPRSDGLWKCKKPALRAGFSNNVAATYSPGCNPSTIGAAGLNFSVRDGKRWDPCARPPKSEVYSGQF